MKKKNLVSGVAMADHRIWVTYYQKNPYGLPEFFLAPFVYKRLSELLHDDFVLTCFATVLKPRMNCILHISALSRKKISSIETCSDNWEFSSKDIHIPSVLPYLSESRNEPWEWDSSLVCPWQSPYTLHIHQWRAPSLDPPLEIHP